MSDLKIKATVVADTSKIKSNIEKIKPVVRVEVDTSGIRRQVERALSQGIQIAPIISGKTTKHLTRTSPSMYNKVERLPEINIKNGNDAENSSGAFSHLAGTIGFINSLILLTGHITKNLG